MASVEKRIFQIAEAAEYIGLSRSRIYELAKAGELELGKLHGRTVVKREVLDAHLDKHYRAAG